MNICKIFIFYNLKYCMKKQQCCKTPRFFNNIVAFYNTYVLKEISL